jgi:hypothetical protein
MNGFSFDSGRGKRRRWRKRGQEAEQPEEQGTGPAGPGTDPDLGSPYAEQDAADYGDPDEDDLPPEVSARHSDEIETSSAAVRPYAWTRGRTRSGLDLQIETLVSTSARGRDQMALLQFEHRSVAQLCERAHSVAEVAATLSVPLGVAKVLLGDMAGLGLVTVHQSVGSNGDVPDLALMERVLSGLRRL